ncbi:cyclin-dependent kinase 2-associated protein 1-like [Choloepus didactylus]|uniref:cyclin-dependent kinase 2-associated protein 1-like n=1 Tax=Choloepus didactylus TaxID=27675 RepID=UPI00189F10F2|nr:cyclin-dependent kinase 2-associated protein 1-like [Choloepus didactylus]
MELRVKRLFFPSSQYHQLLSDYGPSSLGYTQGTGNSQVPQSKYAELLAIIEELGEEIRPTYAGSKSAMERLKRGIIHARGLVRGCLAETEWNAISSRLVSLEGFPSFYKMRSYSSSPLFR